MGQIQTLANFNLEIEIKELVKKRPELDGAKEKLRVLKKHIKPKAFWREMVIDFSENGQISFNQGKFIINSAYLAMGLKDCFKATLVAVTIGEDLPLYAEKCLKKGELWEGTIADILGSEACEILMEKIHAYFKGINLAKGFFSTLRFSPGYGDWLLSGQKEIIDFLETEPLIKVNSNYLLEPAKSITTLIGWASTPLKETYPQGEKKKGFCQGSQNCAHCLTWACKRG